MENRKPMQGKQYAVTLQTPGGPFRGKLFLLVQNQIARGEFSWENMRVPVPRVPVREGEIAFEGMLAFPPVPYTVRFHIGPGENTLEGSVKTPFGTFPVYGRELPEQKRPSSR